MDAEKQMLTKSVLYADMDGTLIGKDQRISEENIAAIRRFVACGGKFSVATGRSEAIAAPFLQELPINAPAILYNGSAVYDFAAGAFLHRQTLDDALAQTLVRTAIAVYPEACVEVFCGGPIKLPNPSGMADHYMEAERQPYCLAKPEDCINVMKLMLYGEHEHLRKVEEAFYRICGGQGFVSTYSAPFYLEILPQNISKGSALRFVMEHLGYDAREFAAIGDYYNDMEMLRAAALSAAPENAPEAVRACADVVVRDHCHHAVADFIDKHLLAEKR